MTTLRLSDYEREQEAEANHFALSLLMPEELVTIELRRRPDFDLLNDRHTAELAKLFQVSVPIMAFRLGQLYGDFRSTTKGRATAEAADPAQVSPSTTTE